VEVEMEGLKGKSKTKMTYKNMRINEDVNFEWMKVK